MRLAGAAGKERKRCRAGGAVSFRRRGCQMGRPACRGRSPLRTVARS